LICQPVHVDSPRVTVWEGSTNHKNIRKRSGQVLNMLTFCDVSTKFMQLSRAHCNMSMSMVIKINTRHGGR
jgi:hypothetical protein